MTTFKSLQANNNDQNPDNFKSIKCHIVEKTLIDPIDDEITLKVNFSSINYKDALAVTGRGKILKHLPLSPGIDASGVVYKSKNKNHREGDKVLITGCNFGEVFGGGYQEYVNIPGSLAIKIPAALDEKKVMIIGTAGFTAMLALEQMQKNDIHPELGLIAVTGATGGVGSWAVHLLQLMGYKTQAWSRKPDKWPWLKKLGANECLEASELNLNCPPLDKGEYAGAIDNVGGETLHYLLSHTKLHGSVASIGLASSAKLQTTVFPFILRGVNLLGISSNNCPWQQRLHIWEKFSDLNKRILWEELLSKQVELDQVYDQSILFIDGKVQGRTLVKI